MAAEAGIAPRLWKNGNWKRPMVTARPRMMPLRDEARIMSIGVRSGAARGAAESLSMAASRRARRITTRAAPAR